MKGLKEKCEGKHRHQKLFLAAKLVPRVLSLAWGGERPWERGCLATPLLNGHQLESLIFSHIYCKIYVSSADTSVKRTRTTIYLGYWLSVKSRWLDIGKVLFCVFVDWDGVEVHKQERGQYPAILTEQTWSINDILYGFRGIFLSGYDG